MLAMFGFRITLLFFSFQMYDVETPEIFMHISANIHADSSCTSESTRIPAHLTPSPFALANLDTNTHVLSHHTFFLHMFNDLRTLSQMFFVAKVFVHVVR